MFVIPLIFILKNELVPFFLPCEWRIRFCGHCLERKWVENHGKIATFTSERTELDFWMLANKASSKRSFSSESGFIEIMSLIIGGDNLQKVKGTMKLEIYPKGLSFAYSFSLRERIKSRIQDWTVGKTSSVCPGLIGILLKRLETWKLWNCQRYGKSNEI